ncbi:MAG: family 16 glycosylhydrolase [Bacteroidales bacterium]|jgi:beta-glucanase (GH16 family)|nr:family 16 glycosylhydrolase [Bacteroidales bacterium]
MPKSFSLITLFFLFIGMPGALLVSCQKETYPVFTPDFSYSVSDDDPNVLRFVNTTTGEHAYMQWDFGNGETTNRQPANKLTYSVFYPLKGDYPVTLTIWGKSGNEDDKKEISKIVSVDYSAPDPDFDYEILGASPNLLKLTDVSTGDYDSISWKLAGKEYAGIPGETRVIYLAMGADYMVELEISRDDISESVVKEITIQADDPDFMDHYEIVWSDEFDGEEIDDEKWLHQTGASGWGNNELQNYTDGENTSVSDGILSITAEKTGSGQNLGDYSSSRINSTESFTYGRFEIRAKMPDYRGPGLWPAIWMLGSSIQEGTSWPLCGEIDIMEYVSWNPDHVSSAIHTESNNHTIGNAVTSGHVSLTSAEEEFHVYGLIWTYTYLEFYIDDPTNVILTYKRPGDYNQENWPFDSPFYFLLNIAVGGTYGGVEGVDDDIFPAVMEIDYVRVYQLR